MDLEKLKKDKQWYWLEIWYEWDRVMTYTKPFKWLHDAKWWLNYRFNPKHKYTIVNTGLKPGYYDKDWIMLNACFAILVDFVEEELPWSSFSKEEDKVPWYMSKSKYVRKNAQKLAFRHFEWRYQARMKMNDNGEYDPDSDLEINHEMTWGWAYKELKELYIWWKYEREKEHTVTNWKDYDIEALDEKDDKQLARLIKVRGYMWT